MPAMSYKHSVQSLPINPGTYTLYPIYIHNNNYKLILPLVSYGTNTTNNPATTNIPPLIYTGTAVSIFDTKAIIGAKIPPIRFAPATNAFPVPRYCVSKISGVYAYSTAYSKLLVKL